MADKSEHGHAGTDEERQHEAANKGGHASHEKGAAHEFTSEDAAEAGRKGGKAAHGAAREGGAGGEGGGGEQTMPRAKKTRGGTHDQHVTAGKKGGSRIRQLIELGYLYEKEHGIGPGRERRRGRRGKVEEGGEGEAAAEGETGGREEAAVASGAGEGGAEEAE